MIVSNSADAGGRAFPTLEKLEWFYSATQQRNTLETSTALLKVDA